MLTRLGYYADKLLEIGWLGAAVAVPLFFNVYSSRVFEPDKIALLRSIVLIMTVLWLVKLIEAGVRARAQTDATTRVGKMNAAVQGVAESGLPSWLGFLRVPMIVAILVYALSYLLSSIFTMTPDATVFGSYQRLQGLYTQLSYMMLGIIVLANMRTRQQVERLVSFIILTSIPVTLYGLVQANRLDPLPWAGDTATRVASSMGNAIFVAAWLIMAVPLTLYRLFTSISSMMAARNDAPEQAVETDDGKRRPVRRATAYVGPDYGWAVVANVVGILFITMFLFMTALKLVAGLPFPDAALWWAVPFALISFYAGGWAIQWLSSHRDDPNQIRYMVIIAGLVFLSAFFAFVTTWSIDTTTISVKIGFDGIGFLWLLFFVLAWGGIAGLAYSFGGHVEETSVRRIGLLPLALSVLYDILFVLIQDASLRGVLWALFFTCGWGALVALAYFFGGQETEVPDLRRGIVALSLNTGYALLIAIQLLCIYLTQSRGPWLGIGFGIFTFATALFFVGRARGVRWMTLSGGLTSGIALLIAIVVIPLNILVNTFNVILPPSLIELPIVGRAIDRVSTLTRTEDGTGKVRTLIWQGATDLIVSDPLRAIIGYGPEAMYVVYNKYYPPDLAHWELRNATPDRSHNVEFDHLVSMGVIGLAAYYFLVAAFFWFGIRVVKRARNTRDQLFGIALISTMIAHFIEIQTGIQIASTWTYFYLLIGMLVAFGYYVTGYLREAAPVAEPAYAGQRAMAGNGAASIPAGASMAAENGKQAALASGGGDGKAARSYAATTTTSANVGASSPSRSASTKAAGSAVGTSGTSTSQRKTQGGRDGNIPNQGQSQGQGRNGGGQMSEARRRQAQTQLRIQPNASDNEWFSNPILPILYAIVLVAAFVFIWHVNIATVVADTYYKQGQSRDNAGQYLTNNKNGSINYYDDAISWQPNQDYYYLFRGRAYLEFAKTIDQQIAALPANATQQQQQQRQQQIDTNRVLFLQKAEDSLIHARDLNPLNTDHYANLGRLYLYWADPTGGKDNSKSPLSVDNMKLATEHSPGNAQLWDELAVSYARNGQFDEATKALRHSQTVDSTYERTPFILGQLLQERADNVKNALTGGSPLPGGGETDYTKLVVQAAEAFSQSITLNPSFFVDNGMQGRVDYLLAASAPFTDTVRHTIINPVQLSDVLTSTITQAYQQKVVPNEKAVANFLRARGVYNGKENLVPATLLDSLWAKPEWAGVRPAGSTKEWLDNDFLTLAHAAVVPYAALGYIEFKLYSQSPAANTQVKDKHLAGATDNYQRAVSLDPSNYFNQKNLGSLYIEHGQQLAGRKVCDQVQTLYDTGLAHLQAAASVVQAQPDVNQDQQKQQDLKQIQDDLSRSQGLKSQPCP